MYSTELKHWLQKSIGLPFFLLALMTAHHSCKKETELPPDTVEVEQGKDYLTIDLDRTNQLEVTREGTYHYAIQTTGVDPYLYLEGLNDPNPADSVVLTFEYQSSARINDLQVFFGPPVSEAQSMRAGEIPSANLWRTWSVVLAGSIEEFDWGNPGDFLRLDFGNQAGVTLQIRNMYLRGLTGAEEEEIRRQEEIIENDLLFKSHLESYLAEDYEAAVTGVNVEASTVTIQGHCPGEGTYLLCEIPPSLHYTELDTFPYKHSLTDPDFTVQVDRFTERDGRVYDRLLSKWGIVKTGGEGDEIVAHARHPDHIVAGRSLTKEEPSGKKGLGGFFDNQFTQDLDDLQISSITVNVTLTGYMHLQPVANSISHTYGGKTYYFDRNMVEKLDRTLREAQKRDIVVAAVLLVQNAAESADPQVGALLEHPHYTPQGIYTMPNLTRPESVHCYAAGLDFLASRYCRNDSPYGRIHHWIMHNEVDAGLTWTNMGIKPMMVYLNSYYKSMRMCYNIVRTYDEHSQIFGSFTHSWAYSVGSNFFSSKEMLETLLDFSAAEGDFQWAVAYHSYPEDLNDPRTWEDTKAHFSMDSPLVTFKNLEVLDAWIKQPETFYEGEMKRTVWLSENGTNSRTYSEQDLQEQAAGLAYAWKKLKMLDGIEAMQWHNWIDNRYEFGLRIGLRRFPDDETDPAGRKPVWYVYEAAGTAEEEGVFEPYKQIIGIDDWSEILNRDVGP